MLSLSAAVSAALYIQATAPAPSIAGTADAHAEQAATIDEMVGLMGRVFETIGVCHLVLPPVVGEQMRAALSGEAADQNSPGNALLLEAYERGRASPRARTITSERCMADLNAIGAEVQAMKAELEAEQAAAPAGG